MIELYKKWQVGGKIITPPCWLRNETLKGNRKAGCIKRNNRWIPVYLTEWIILKENGKLYKVKNISK